jgi:hydrogenase/urease accessory protein HupE
LIAVVFLAALPAQAHRMALARVVITEGATTVVQVAMNPQAAKHRLRPLPPPGCVQTQAWRSTIDPMHLRGAWLCEAPIQTLRFSTQGRFEGTVLARLETQDGAIERLSRHGAALHFSTERVAQTAAAGQLLAGMTHLLSGWDHLLLIALLALHFRGLVPLLRATVSFTAGHALSLGLAAFGLVALPLPPVEACIALSLMIMAWHCLREAPGQGAVPIALLGAFGLLHGLGLASGFAAAGLQRWDLVGAVLLFNIGVELAQLLWLGVVILATRALPLAPRLSHDILAYSAGGLAAFWLIQRSTTLGGA